ncbi:hypothetical protein [Rhizobium ruizarguesonis]|uniref:hypothetical protein n=1 Tax=Rhizobium ruizarguesonis TaxID=2081791 RepID=UPI002E140803|nr:hypothetical protein U8Q07_24635 [Rhizobium ruizarguesonis]WSH33664.1 hypothetical protein U8P70_24710 [Rhizobium ruizarguesonis]
MTAESTETTVENENSEENSRSDASRGSLTWQPEGADFLLVWLVFLAEHGVSQDVTLNVGGSLVSGTIIKGAEYLDELAATYSSAESNGPRDTLDGLARSVEEFKPLYNTEGLDLSNFKPHYIHLKSAFVLQASDSKLPTDNGFLWRGRLSAVDAFSLGRLG